LLNSGFISFLEEHSTHTPALLRWGAVAIGFGFSPQLSQNPKSIDSFDPNSLESSMPEFL
jgi:hypothetical protein